MTSQQERSLLEKLVRTKSETMENCIFESHYIIIFDKSAEILFQKIRILHGFKNYHSGILHNFEQSIFTYN